MLILRGQRTEVRCLAFSPSGDLLASGGVNKSVRLWDRRTGRPRSVFRDHPGYIHALAFAPDGRTLAVGTRHLFLRDLETGAVALGNVEPYRLVRAVCFSPDGRTVVSIKQTFGGPEVTRGHGVVTLWDVTGLPTRAGDDTLGRYPEDEHPSIPRRHDLTASVLQAALGSLYPLLTEGTSLDDNLEGLEASMGVVFPAWTAAFSPDGRELAVGSIAVLLWNLAQGRSRIAKNTGWGVRTVRAVAFSPDGQLLAGAVDKQVQVWDSQTLTPVATVRGHRDRVTSLAFAPGSTALLTGSEDETVRLWDATMGRERAAFRWPTGRVHAVAFAPDSMTAAAAGQNGQIVLWDIDAG